MILVKEQARELLISSSATDSTPLYNSGTTYGKNDVVQYEDNIYVSVANSNTEPPSNGEKWYNWDNVNKRPFPVKFPTNKYRCFDDYSYETSTIGDNLTIVFDNNICTFLGLYNIIADRVRVTMYDEDGTTILYQEERETIGDPLWDYIDYYYWVDRGLIVNMEFTLPRHILGTTKVEFIGTGSSVGTVEYGALQQLGCSLTRTTKYSYTGLEKASIDNATGIAYYKEAIRGGTSNISAEVKIKSKEELNELTYILHQYRDRIITILADDREQENASLDVFRIRGKITSFETTLTNAAHRYTISIDSL